LGFGKSVNLMHVPHECAHKLGVRFWLDGYDWRH
jgi:hypothetical protein